MSAIRNVVSGGFSSTKRLVLLSLVAGIGFAASAGVAGEGKVPERKGKQTTLGLYVTAKEAYDMWKAAPDKAKLIDVRTPEEFAFVGHPEMAWNIPLAFVTYQQKDGKTEHGVRMNKDFVAQIETIAKPEDTLILMCRSGDRSAMACNALAKAGFKKAYTITDGFEGDKVDDPDNLYNGKRMKNGWTNSGLPWVYTFDSEKILIPEDVIRQ